MPLQNRSFDIGDGRQVSGVVALADTAPSGTAVILGHGAGSDMNSPFLSTVHEGLAQRGYTSIKFNFPYKERHGRAPDPAPVLEKCWQHVIDAVRADKKIGARRIVIGGKSMGGRMASHVAAQGADVAGLVFLGYPLHPPGRTDKLRVAHLSKITAPMLFFTGTRDTLCKLDLLEATIAKLRVPVTLHVIDGGDHSFKLLKSLKRNDAEVLQEIIGATAEWLKKIGTPSSKSK